MSATRVYERAQGGRSDGDGVVSDFPDPQVTTTPGGGGVGIRQAVPAGAGLSPRFQSAQKACQGIVRAPGNGRHGNQPSKQVFRAFDAACAITGFRAFPTRMPRVH
ncbi:MAG TPA: hypothetical protein VEF89_19725 [Solirubrobacteraceae bacterium]|nr:hypothetical protein [Solirubrobacteraceae bacterium]